MPDDEALSQLALVGRLEVLAFDARVTGTPHGHFALCI
jgi:hypothetical protein